MNLRTGRPAGTADGARGLRGLGRGLRSNRLPLRGRLALLAAAAVALSVMAAALVSYRLVDNELNNQLNQQMVDASMRPAQNAPQAGGPGAGALPGGQGSQSVCAASPSPFSSLNGSSTAAGSAAGGDGSADAGTSEPSGISIIGPVNGGPAIVGGDQYVTQFVETDGTVCLPGVDFGGKTYTFADYKVNSTTQDQAVASGAAPGYFRDDVTSTGDAVRVYTTHMRGDVAVQTIAEIGGLNSALSSLRWKLGLVALAGIFLAVLAGLLVARSALVPVRRLTRVAEHVGRTGDLSVRLPAESRDEVGRLGRAFNAMAAALALSRDRQRRLIADAGHELRTPLTSLRTNVDLMLRSERTGRALPTGRREAMLESVDQQLHELSGLVTDLLELSRTAEGGKRSTMKVALHEVVGRAVQRARLRGPGLVFDVEVEPWYVQGDPTGLDRAVVNLLDNAVKFSPAGGVVTVRLHRGEYSVTDRGPGISAEDLPKVFERFYRSDSARSLPGSGLGLAIVAQVAKESDGAISLEPAHDRDHDGPIGTVARLRLPGSATAPATGSGGDSGATSGAGTGRNSGSGTDPGSAAGSAAGPGADSGAGRPSRPAAT
ncbi:MAG TPA: HAMP domain-containing sensor histidine kinase [Actinocrinis sp.]|nr:HAMP domain-containing sensor histidine kinase [Actinocrinis sp.]